MLATRSQTAAFLAFALLLGATLFWAGWSYSRNIADISQGQHLPSTPASKAWSDTLA